MECFEKRRGSGADAAQGYSKNGFHRLSASFVSSWLGALEAPADSVTFDG